MAARMQCRTASTLTSTLWALLVRTLDFTGRTRMGRARSRDTGADWYRSLTNSKHEYCCSRQRDCEKVDDYRPSSKPGSYEAWWRGQWVSIPAIGVDGPHDCIRSDMTEPPPRPVRSR